MIDIKIVRLSPWQFSSQAAVKKVFNLISACGFTVKSFLMELIIVFVIFEIFGLLCK